MLGPKSHDLITPDDTPACLENISPPFESSYKPGIIITDTPSQVLLVPVRLTGFHYAIHEIESIKQFLEQFQLIISNATQVEAF